MINFPKKPESKLEQLIDLKKRIADLEIGVKLLMPDAINEAINLLSNKGNIALQNDKAKVIVRFNKTYQSSKDNVVLARLEADIDNELSSIAHQNQEQLSTIQDQLEKLNQAHREADPCGIANLEEEEKNLLTSPRLINLKKQFETEKLKTEELTPQLAIQLKF